MRPPVGNKKSISDQLWLLTIVRRPLYSDKIDLLNHLTHTKVIAIKKAFSEFPGGRVDLDQFVHLMREILKDTDLFRRENLENDLMDLYYRVNHKN